MAFYGQQLAFRVAAVAGLATGAFAVTGLVSGCTIMVRETRFALQNITDARSQIHDTDFASTTAQLTQSQILAQAGISVLQIAKEVIRVLGRGSLNHVDWPETRKRIEIENVRISSELLTKITGWKPRYSFVQGLEKTREIIQREGA